MQYFQILLLCVLRRAEYDARSVRKQMRDNNNQAVSPPAVWALGQRWAPTQQDSLKPLLTHSLTGRGHWARANQQGTKSERWAATHKSGTGQVPKRIVTWRWHKVRRLGSDKITRKITGSKQLRWMAASEQLRRAPKVSTAARYFSTTITIFPPTSPFKRIIWSFTFRALHRPITIANFCSAEKKIISISTFCQASKIPSIEERKHKKTWKLPTSRVKKKIY